MIIFRKTGFSKKIIRLKFLSQDRILYVYEHDFSDSDGE